MTRRVIAQLRSFGAFWYDFVIGDDWRVAVAVALALATTYGVSRATPDSWWIVPCAIAVLLPVSVWRASRKP
jgi:uncharacterized membrane protein